MRRLTFDSGDIREWARFSGDQNPIHFAKTDLFDFF